MASPATEIADRRYTMQEYLDIVETLEGKYEYVDGKLVDWRAMAGAAEPHALITANIIGEAREALKGKPCRVYLSDLILRIHRKSKYRFGDVVVVCGTTEFDPDDKSQARAVTNPKLIIEVMSPTSEGVDRGEKFTDYREIPSFEEYVLVSQREPAVESYRRQDDGTWVVSFINGLDAEVRLQSIDLTLSLREIFAGVTFPVPQAGVVTRADHPVTREAKVSKDR